MQVKSVVNKYFIKFVSFFKRSLREDQHLDNEVKLILHLEINLFCSATIKC